MSDEKIHSYSSPFAVGHRALDRREDSPGLFDVDVFVTEKIDGSQFSFQRVGNGVRFRSRGQVVYPESAGMFKAGVNALLEIADQLQEGWVYRGEYLAKPHHNILSYSRTPERHVILFDCERSPSQFLSYAELEAEAARLGLEVVPLLYTGRIASLDILRELLNEDSVLGGTKVEGIVVKPVGHNLWGQDKKVLMGKMVREDFKEKHEKEWKRSNPTKADVIQELINTYRTEARWHKAVQHLREVGQIEDAPRDIGKLIKEVPADILKECKDEIKDALFKHFWKEIQRGVVRGLPEWYKKLLEERVF